ncbi:molybdopterin molybdotransferase MoeA [Isoptericola sp. b441]|uniref:Molybdopterin molybdenumtransferase n=1 Tax=Actinotalea lenta TaxID=3064654 RepID=A0ABT9D7A3_9CELL|nr:MULTISPECIES: gephyrin-like molybdotransferase Glp [unclassified Isoptericola]MDO8106709.1 molybdopterin molybdotransferase MoeA [Isoptericola sp. b441]MDO8121579.1 molybdopterin molybdotransferase MoeA [Isoptericola sp. b490]
MNHPSEPIAPTLRGVAEHRAAVLELARVTGTDEVDVGAGLGRVLARDVTAAGSLPAWDSSAMDGYAVRGADLARSSADSPAVLDVVGEAAAGVPSAVPVAPGTAVRIMTGAPVPAGADAVVRQEDVARHGARVSIGRPAHRGEHIRPAGDDVRAGERVLAAGADLGPAQLAAAVSAGARSLVVRRRPRVAVLSTGAELVAAGGALGPAQIHDSNSVLLAAAATEAGAEVVYRDGVTDDVAALRTALAELDGAVDLVVTSGGVSVGDHDVVREALTGPVSFVRVAMQPGKPQGSGRLAAGTPVVCLPGNPVSAFVSFEVFVRPLLRTMLAAAAVEQRSGWGVADDAWRVPADREQYMPVRLEDAATDLPRVRRAVPGGSGSHLVAGLAAAQGLAVVPAHVRHVRPGDRLRVRWL